MTREELILKLEVMQNNSEFKGFPENDFNFKELDNESLFYYIEWINSDGPCEDEESFEETSTPLQDDLILLERNVDGFATPVYFKESFIKKWLDGVTDGTQSVESFLNDYISDDVEALLDFQNRQLKEDK